MNQAGYKIICTYTPTNYCKMSKQEKQKFTVTYTITYISYYRKITLNVFRKKTKIKKKSYTTQGDEKQNSITLQCDVTPPQNTKKKKQENIKRVVHTLSKITPHNQSQCTTTTTTKRNKTKHGEY